MEARERSEDHVWIKDHKLDEKHSELREVEESKAENLSLGWIEQENEKGHLEILEKKGKGVRKDNEKNNGQVESREKMDKENQELRKGINMESDEQGLQDLAIRLPFRELDSNGWKGLEIREEVTRKTGKGT